MASVRRWLNDSNAATYKWTTAELVDHYNWCLDDIARRTDYFIDSYTDAISYITLVAGTPDYALDSRITQIISAQVDGESQPLSQTTSRERTQENRQWRYSASAAGADIAFVSGTPATITSTTTDFLEHGLKDDEYLKIAGCATAGNNKTVLVDSVTANLITLATGETLTSVAASSMILLRQINTDTPQRFMVDYREGYITFDPCPDASGMVYLDTTRKQLTELTEATISTATIPVKSEYHYGLIQGMQMLAFQKSGPNTFNFEKFKLNKELWDYFVSSIRKDRIKLNAKNTTIGAHKGAT